MKMKLLVSSAAAVLMLAGAAFVGGAAAGLVTLDPAKFGLTLFTSMAQPLDDPTQPTFQVKPQEFDPGKTNLVQSAWLPAIGCPTDAQIALPNATFTDFTGLQPYQDSACPTGDPNDKRHEGLLLVKTGPTLNFASATAELTRVKGITLTELGWDMRKPRSAVDPSGSHCGAGGPRWNVLTTDGVGHFIGCNSPPAAQTATGTGWIRMRWTAAILAAAFPPIGPLDRVSRIQILLDEGQDVGPDNFGLVVLDNITVNGTMVGRGAVDAD
jgi:hypothetical protein